MPTSVIRRYTPPTCTLEIAATGSALSRWTDRTILKNLRFQLSLDDPALASDKQVAIKGDRPQLEALSDAVSTYIQTFLMASPEQVRLPRELSASAAALSPGSVPATAVEPGATTAAGVYLQPKSLLAHDLHLGTLANEESGAVVHLSTLQLFDLANALDEYNAEAVSLPALGRPTWLKSLPTWGKTAAIAVLALGATTAIAKFVLDVSTPTTTYQTAQTATTTSRQAETGLDQQANASPETLPPAPGTSGASPSPFTLVPVPPPPPEGATQPSAPKLPSVTIPQVAPTSAPPPQPPAGSQSAPSTERLIPVPPESVNAAGSSSSQASSGPSSSVRAGSAAPRLNVIGGGSSPLSAEAARTAAQLDQPNYTADSANGGDSGSSPRVATNSTIFDTIPQVAEVRKYFQQHWQPPDGLKETLEYRLLLNTDGSLQRIVPLGQAAATYIDRTSMPLMGEPFVSAVAGGRNPQIRLVLQPDGKVQTFLEYAN
jgi:hypothetical protein